MIYFILNKTNLCLFFCNFNNSHSLFSTVLIMGVRRIISPVFIIIIINKKRKNEKNSQLNVRFVRASTYHRRGRFNNVTRHVRACTRFSDKLTIYDNYYKYVKTKEKKINMKIRKKKIQKKNTPTKRTDSGE